nr:hypothetical protein Iba_chr12aCG10910 [Ipomoea batatas]
MLVDSNVHNSLENAMDEELERFSEHTMGDASTGKNETAMFEELASLSPDVASPCVDNVHIHPFALTHRPSPFSFCTYDASTLSLKFDDLSGLHDWILSGDRLSASSFVVVAAVVSVRVSVFAAEKLAATASESG